MMKSLDEKMQKKENMRLLRPNMRKRSQLTSKYVLDDILLQLLKIGSKSKMLAICQTRKKVLQNMYFEKNERI